MTFKCYVGYSVVLLVMYLSYANLALKDHNDKVTERLEQEEEKEHCSCKKFSCSCCTDLSFVKKWEALGCLNIVNFPGDLNLFISITFNKYVLGYYPIVGSNPPPFCRRCHLHNLRFCLYVYNIKMATQSDISFCTYAEMKLGIHSAVTVSFDCVRMVNHSLHLIPKRKKKQGLIDVYITKNVTVVTIFKQPFHIHYNKDKAHNPNVSKNKSRSKFFPNYQNVIRYFHKYTKKLFWWR